MGEESEEAYAFYAQRKKIIFLCALCELCGEISTGIGEEMNPENQFELRTARASQTPKVASEPTAKQT